MDMQKDTIIKPTPDMKLLTERERKWRLKLPPAYRDFLMQYNGGIPTKQAFSKGEWEYVITRFLGVMQSVQKTDDGWYDISVVESQIGERLTHNEDLIGIEVLPIAELFAGDYVCLDFREDKNNPCVCVWSHEESEDFSPVTYKVADNFLEFIEMLR